MSCVFCQIISRETPGYVVYEDAQRLAFLDKYPQTRGHLQLVPKTHTRWIYELPDIASFFICAQKLIRVIIPTLGADHVTLASFGKQVPHAHLWIVPQYKEEVRIAEGFSREKQDLEALALVLKNSLNSKHEARNSKQ